jgi:hypothetical protein
MNSNGQVFNCAVDDPTTWDVTKWLYVQMVPGTGIGLAKQNNLLMALTDRSVQFFYNEANIAGSPLTNVEQAMHKIGCVNRGSIASQEETIYWIGNSQTGSPTVFRLNGVSDLQEIGSPSINRYLNNLTSGALASYIVGNTARISGRTFYILSISGLTGTSGSALAGIAIAGYAKATLSALTLERTFVYDPHIDYWYEWYSGTRCYRW